MRISSSVYQLQWLASIQRQQQELADNQSQVSSGKRINTAADDPAGTAQAILLQQGLDRLANYASNGQTAQRRLGLEENSLSQVTDTLNRVRELAVQAGTGVQTADSRSAIVAEAAELLKGLVNTANAQDGEGRYLFAGNQVNARPFVQSGTVQYAGDNGARSQRVADARTVQEGDPGSAVFMQIPAANGSYSIAAGPGNQGSASWSSATVASGQAFVPGNYTVTFTSPDTWEARSGGTLVASGSYAPGGTISFQGASVEFQGTPAAGDTFTVATAGYKDMFSTVQDFITTLAQSTDTPAGRAVFQNRLNSDLQNLDQALQHISNVRSQVGARLSTIDQQLDNNADVNLELTNSLSAIRDLDYPTAISKLEQQLNSLQVAQKAYARTQSLSLFDVL